MKPIAFWSIELIIWIAVTLGLVLYTVYVWTTYDPFIMNLNETCLMVGC